MTYNNPSGKLLASAHKKFFHAKRRWEGRRKEEKYSLELLVSRVLECIEVETATCALLYTTVPHCMGILTGRLAYKPLSTFWECVYKRF